MKLATDLGWLVYHAYQPKYDNAGFPDIVAVRAPDLHFLELKAAKGVKSEEQKQWIGQLGQVTQVTAGFYYPHQIQEIADLLARRRTR